MVEEAAPYGYFLMMYMSLCIVLGQWVPPEVIGVLYYRLKDKFSPQDLVEPPLRAFPYEGMRDFCEYSLYRGWMEQYLKYLKWYCSLDLEAQYTLDAFLLAPVCTKEWYARPKDEQSGVLFSMYDWAYALLKRKPRVLQATASFVIYL